MIELDLSKFRTAGRQELSDFEDQFKLPRGSFAFENPWKVLILPLLRYSKSQVFIIGMIDKEFREDAPGDSGVVALKIFSDSYPHGLEIPLEIVSFESMGRRARRDELMSQANLLDTGSNPIVDVSSQDVTSIITRVREEWWDSLIDQIEKSVLNE